MKRPPVETYARCSVTRGDLTIEPGVELRPADDAGTVVRELREIADGVCRDIEALRGKHPHLDVAARCAARRIRMQFGDDRAYFVEVYRGAGWVQIFQPYGVPRNAAPWWRRALARLAWWRR